MNRGPAVAVMDVGKTSAKVVAVDRSGVVRRRLAHANRSSDAGPYRHVEVDELFEWIVKALQAVAAAEAIEAVGATAHGAAAALVDEERLASPVMDYEAAPLDEWNPRADTGDVRFVFDVNFMGSFFTSRAVLPWMLNQNYGRILHIASIAGKEGNAGMLAYSASKAAVIAMDKVQGKEYAETGITINALAPAVIRTAMVEALPEAQVKYMTEKIPMGRCGTLEEVAHTAAFIVSPGLEWFRLQSVVLGSNGHRLTPVPPDAPRGKPDEL